MSEIKHRTRTALRGLSGNRLAAVEQRVSALEATLEETRRLNERLSDVLDVVVELLVPAVDRDDARLHQALDKLGKLV